MELGKLLAGLVTITLSSLLTVHSLRIAVKINKDNINVKGNNNVVINQTNNLGSAPNFSEYSLMGNVIAVLIAVVYPFIGNAINMIFFMLSIIGVPIALSAWWTLNQSSGWKRGWDTFYVIGTAAACWVLYHLEPHLQYTADKAQLISKQFRYLINYGFQANHQVLFETVFSLFALVGVGILFSCSVHMIFAFLNERSSFNKAWLYTTANLAAIVFFGLVAVHSLTAVLYFHNPDFLLNLLKSLFPFLSDL